MASFWHFSIFLALSTACIFQNTHAETLALSVNAEAAILMNADTGAILYEKNPHMLCFPASITKIATALYVLQNFDNQLDAKITADQELLGCVTEDVKRKGNYEVTPSYILVTGGTHMGIKKGEILSLKDLLYGMMLVSGNDAANVIAHYAGGSIPRFMQDLNAYLKQIGCRSTVFQNPHGLHHPNHQTTAYDMAILAKEALKNPIFREIVSSPRHTRPKTNKQEATTLVQSNRMLRPGNFYYPKAIGVKTGYTSMAKSTFVSAAKDGERTLIVVLLKTEERKDMFSDAAKMFEAAFSQPKVQRVLLRQGPQKFSLELAGAEKPVTTFISEDLFVDYFPAEEPKIKCLLNWGPSLHPPIMKNSLVGTLVFQLGDREEWRKVPLYAQETVLETWPHRLKNLFITPAKSSWHLKIIGMVIVGIFLGFFVLQLRRR